MEYQMIIGGEAVKSENYFDVNDPATGELVGKCPIADKSDLDAAVDAARAAFPAWSSLADEERQGLCHAIGQVIEDNAEENCTSLDTRARQTIEWHWVQI